MDRSPYERIGEAGVAALVNSFYDIVEGDPAFRRLRDLHAADMGPVRHGLTRFLAGWLGGPRDWFAGGQCIMGLHRKFAIDVELADQWSRAMQMAIAAQDWPDARLGDAMGEALANMADAMLNRSVAAAAS